jgi:hypothetical protein
MVSSTCVPTRVAGDGVDGQQQAEREHPGIRDGRPDACAGIAGVVMKVKSRLKSTFGGEQADHGDQDREEED